MLHVDMRANGIADLSPGRFLQDILGWMGDARYGTYLHVGLVKGSLLNSCSCLWLFWSGSGWGWGGGDGDGRAAVMFLYNDSVLGNDFSYRLHMNKAFISKSGQRCGLRMALTC